MTEKIKKPKFPSELRMDIVSGDWVLIASGRAKKPKTFKEEKRQKETLSQQECPFCELKNQKPILIFSKGKKIAPDGQKIPEIWTTLVIPNKYPAVVPGQELSEETEGPVYKKMDAVGFHEVVITRHHSRQLAQFSVEEIKEVIDVYEERYLALSKEKFVNYISIFHNHGKEAGATISHPHSQIITTPLIDTDLKKTLLNSGDFFRRKGNCVYCLMNSWEKKVKKRIVFENKNFLALCPFASKAAFEVIISPKKHLTCFEQLTEEEKRDLSQAFGVVLAKLYRGLNDPAYNFYLHTAPCDGKEYPFYHWHWTILPKTAVPAGFELGTRMEISTIEPEKAAAYLRSQ